MGTRIDWIDKKKLNPVIDLDRMADLLGVPTLNEMDDKYWFECMPDDPESDDPHSSERDECWREYENALVSVFTSLCEDHDLTLTKLGGGQWKLAPKVAWKYSAKCVMETINGVGMFHFQNVREFVDSGPYTERAAVLTHLHWLKRYPDVYGTGSINRMMERATR